MKVLVTGGSGFIGSHVVDRLIKQGRGVRILDIRPPHRADVEYVRGDITRESDCSGALRGMDAVYHIAAFSNIDLVKDNPVAAVEANILGTARLLHAAVQRGIKRFIFASSVFTYEGTGHIYTTAKACSEMLCRDFHTLYGLPYTILRYGTVYGPRNRGADVISLFIKRALQGQKLMVRGTGKQTRNFIYVEDLANASALALSKKAENKIFRVAHPEAVSVRELARLVRKIFRNTVAVAYERGRSDDYRGRVSAEEHSFSELGWKPKVPLEQGIRRTIEWFTTR